MWKAANFLTNSRWVNCETGLGLAIGLTGRLGLTSVTELRGKLGRSFYLVNNFGTRSLALRVVANLDMWRGYGVSANQGFMCDKLKFIDL